MCLSWSSTCDFKTQTRQNQTKHQTLNLVNEMANLTAKFQRCSEQTQVLIHKITVNHKGKKQSLHPQTVCTGGEEGQKQTGSVVTKSHVSRRAEGWGSPGHDEGTVLKCIVAESSLNLDKRNWSSLPNISQYLGTMPAQPTKCQIVFMGKRCNCITNIVHAPVQIIVPDRWRLW